MQNIKIIALAVVAVVALSATMTSGAAAEEFIASKTGTLKGKALSASIINTGGAETECTESELASRVSHLTETELEFFMSLLKCRVGGILEGTVTSLSDTLFTPAQLSILGGGATITATGVGITCKIFIDGGQTLGSASKELEYINKSGKIEIKEKITKVAYEVEESNSATLCGKAGEKGTAGTLSSDSEVELEGGTIEVK